MYADMEARGASASERAKVGTALRMALKQACRLRLLGHNVAGDVPKPKVAREEIQPLDPSQMGLILRAADGDRLAALYTLALDSGMRQGEIFGLHWTDVDFAAAAVQVRRSLEEMAGTTRLKDVKTAKARRRIDLSPDTVAALNEHRQRMLAEGLDVRAGPVFADTDGNFLRKSNVARRSFARIVQRAGELAAADAERLGLPHAASLPRKLSFHDLRHTTATLLLLTGENVKVVSERLGHGSVEITLNVYSHVLPSMGKRAAETMAGIFNRARAESGGGA